MAIPTRIEAAAILRSLKPKDTLLTHSAVTGEIAAFICAAMVRRGVAVNSTLAETAALLHDVDKALPAGHPVRKLGHGIGGAKWLTDRGYQEIAVAVANHSVGFLAAAASYDEYAQGTGLEGLIVAYADKRALQDLVSLDVRFARWQKRYPDSESLPIALERAREMERDICSRAGIEPDGVQRLAWVDDALKQAAKAA
jgi:putative nucleotidyltransferase with HDIG domain